MQKTLIFLALILVAASAFNFKTFTKIIEEEVKQAKTTWTAGYNKHFENWSYQDIRNLMGLKQAPPSMRLSEKALADEEIAVMDIPSSFDPREFWPRCESIKEIRDQANCGSCWAFGSAEAMSDRICIASGQKVQTRISTENLLSCCVGMFACGNGCNGGFIEGAWSYFQKTGLVTGNLYEENKYCQPYAFPPCDHHVQGQYSPCEGMQKTPKCVKECNSEYNVPYEQDIHKGQSTYKVKASVEQIQAELMTNGPVTAGITVYEDFLTYTGGVYQHTTGSYAGGHAIKILGWGVENGTPYWLCANSWNEDWGLGGLFKILRGVNECGIESQVVAGLV